MYAVKNLKPLGELLDVGGHASGRSLGQATKSWQQATGRAMQLVRLAPRACSSSRSTRRAQWCLTKLNHFGKKAVFTVAFVSYDRQREEDHRVRVRAKPSRSSTITTTSKMSPKTVTIRRNGKVRSVAWSYDGKYLAVGTENRVVADLQSLCHPQILEKSTAIPEAKCIERDGKVWTVAWSKDSKYLAVGSFEDQTVAIIGAKDLVKKRELILDGNVTSVAFSKDNRFLAVEDPIKVMQVSSKGLAGALKADGGVSDARRVRRAGSPMTGGTRRFSPAQSSTPSRRDSGCASSAPRARAPSLSTCC